MRLIIMGGIPEHDLESMLDLDLESHHEDSVRPSFQLARIGDALPGLGIVAAVLGVVITMGAIGGRALPIFLPIPETAGWLSSS